MKYPPTPSVGSRPDAGFNPLPEVCLATYSSHCYCILSTTVPPPLYPLPSREGLRSRRDATVSSLVAPSSPQLLPQLQQRRWQRACRGGACTCYGHRRFAKGASALSLMVLMAPSSPRMDATAAAQAVEAGLLGRGKHQLDPKELSKLIRIGGHLSDCTPLLYMHHPLLRLPSTDYANIASIHSPPRHEVHIHPPSISLPPHSFNCLEFSCRVQSSFILSGGNMCTNTPQSRPSTSLTSSSLCSRPPSSSAACPPASTRPVAQ